MHCATCDTPNESEARFCRACGTSLSAAPAYVISNAPMAGPPCPACRQRNPAGAHYCVYCATQLTSAAPRMAAHSATGSTSAVAQIYAARPMFQAPSLVGGFYLIRAVWFLLIGWWLGLIWTIVAWLFNLTLIGLPVGALMINAIPQIMTLRTKGPALRTVHVGPEGAMVTLRRSQQPLALRAIWFLLVGSWASLLWMLTAWWFCATIILMPIAFWMFDRVPTISTLAAE